MSLVLALLVACKAPETDTINDSDTAVETDSAAAETTLRVTPDDALAFQTKTLALFPLDTTFFAVLSETPLEPTPLVDGVYSLAYTPPSDALFDAPWATGLKVASYALVAYDNAPDANGLFGITRFDAVYLQGAVPEPYAAIGLHEGWNALRADDEGPPDVGDPLALTLEANLVPATDATATGTWDAPQTTFVAAFSTEDATIAVGSHTSTDPWEVTAAGNPPASTWFSTPDVTVAGFRVGAYADVDASGDWTTGDTISAVAVTAQDEPAWLSWGAPVASAHEAHVLVTRGGFRVGWSAVKGTEGSTPLAPEDTLRFVAGTP